MNVKPRSKTYFKEGTEKVHNFVNHFLELSMILSDRYKNPSDDLLLNILSTVGNYPPMFSSSKEKVNKKLLAAR